MAIDAARNVGLPGQSIWQCSLSQKRIAVVGFKTQKNYVDQTLFHRRENPRLKGLADFLQ
jgi:hypothetical protein